MKFATKKDSRKRKLYNKYEVDYIIHHVLSAEKPKLGFKLRSTDRLITKHRAKNRCVLTSRPKGVLRFFKLSRMCFKEKASFGFLEGVGRASW